ncbi:MAG: GNAT family N-acetyltransferase, partial [bacterium]
MTDSTIQIRPAIVDDIDDVVRLRRQMFEDMGYRDEQVLTASDDACREYFRRTIPSGVYRGWLATTDDGHAVASSGLVIDFHPPGPNNPGGRIGYIMNLATEPGYRRQGLARRIFGEM